MSKRHHKKEGEKGVRSKYDIAMDRAKEMGTAMPGGGGEDARQVSLPEGELKELREKAARAGEYHERLLRVAADLENYKKQVERERQNLLKFGQEQIIAELLLVLDNFERAILAAGSSSDLKSLTDGVTLIQKQLLTALKKNGLEPIEALGRPFDPRLHEAIAQVMTDEHPDGTVVGEQLKGYTLNKRVLRPAAVTVSATRDEAGAPHDEKEEAADG